MKIKALIAEFIATFALTFVGIGAIASNYITDGGSGLVGIALAHGLTIAVMVAAIGAISGAHINPAVTIGLLCTKNIDAQNATIFSCFYHMRSCILIIIDRTGVLCYAPPYKAITRIYVHLPNQN